MLGIASRTAARRCRGPTEPNQPTSACRALDDGRIDRPMVRRRQRRSRWPLGRRRAALTRRRRLVFSKRSPASGTCSPSTTTAPTRGGSPRSPSPMRCRHGLLTERAGLRPRRTVAQRSIRDRSRRDAVSNSSPISTAGSRSPPGHPMATTSRSSGVTTTSNGWGHPGELWVIDRDGSDLRTAAAATTTAIPAWSPDGRFIVVRQPRRRRPHRAARPQDRDGFRPRRGFLPPLVTRRNPYRLRSSRRRRRQRHLHHVSRRRRPNATH